MQPPQTILSPQANLILILTLAENISHNEFISAVRSPLFLLTVDHYRLSLSLHATSTKAKAIFYPNLRFGLPKLIGCPFPLYPFLYTYLYLSIYASLILERISLVPAKWNSTLSEIGECCIIVSLYVIFMAVVEDV